MWLFKNSIHQTGSSFLNSVINKPSFELHLLGHICTGPGTKLVERVNSDEIPKEWSVPINRVDNGLIITIYTIVSTMILKTRNLVCDKVTLTEFDVIVNPNLRERSDKSIVGKLIKTKVNFG